MRLTLSASVSSLGRGDGDRLGVRTKKKHKRLDAISEDVFIRSRDVRIGDIGRSGGGGSVENDDSEVRRSSRVRRAPEVLDSSPPAKRRRRKGGRGRGYGGFRGKGKVENEAGSEGSGSSDEELGSWRSRTSLRLKEKKSRGKRKLFENVEEDEEDVRATRDLNLEDEEPIVDGETSGDENDAKVDSVEGSNTRGKKKLYEAVEEDEEEAARSMKNTTVDNLKEEGPCLDGEKSGDEEETMVDRVGGSIDVRIETEDDHSIGERFARGVDDLVNEEVGDCTPSTIGVIEEIDREVPTVTMLDEKVDRNEHTGGSSQTDKPVNSHELVESAETQNQATGATPLPTVLAENGNDEVAKNMEPKNGLKVKNNVAAGEHPKPRIKEGRRCGLCGGGTDGKPPKKLVTDSGGSDLEAYSGSSASEEFSYDLWDGFGDESGWQGKLLGPVNDRHGIAGIWVHQHCAVWSPEVYFAGLGRLKNIRAALCRGRALKCTRCGRPGATLGCRVDRCPRTYHLPCARASGCHFDHRKFLIACVDHRYLFEPHGHQYSQRIKKLKAKKMKFEVRKLSNDASRKDLEEEEKWMEKCGEDEEFLRRETKRLQRDLLRIAPVYIGGPHSEGENPIGGWESVAGLQDVVQCMKEVVILPLLYPEFFGNMGITPPRGVLLHGYPGTGKTLVVRALIGSCARGDKRIAYFARKGADCLGKYVGDAERQLRLLFQVAEKSQPSIIFFDEIDGLAPVRTRQQDQTHSSVVSTLLALMDGLKSRGSVIVIGATNRPDSVDPALRRPGRFDREIYFPLPSLKDRSAILALHTRKWPKPVSGPLLERVASQTVGFAGADLQALCAQAAVIGLKRNCSWHQILSSAEENPEKGRRPELPSFEVEERDWLEALCLAPPPCSRREAGIAANEVLGTPLDAHLVPCLLQPLLSLILSFYLDDRLWLPHCLVAAGKAVKKALVSQMEAKNLQNNKWVYLAQNMAQNPNIAREIVRNLIDVGIVKGDASLAGFDISKDASFDDGETYRCSFGDRPSGMSRNVRYAPSKNAGYRIMISGAPRCGQKHLASCLLHSFLGNIEIQKLDLATISQEGHGDMEQGILRILLKCASLRTCVIFMPRLDFWAIESHTQSLEQDVEVSPVCESPKGSSLMPCQDSQNETCYVSKIWKIFREQLECLCISSSSIILATSELPHASLPFEIRQFFGSQLLASEGLSRMEQGTPRFSVEVNGELDQNELIHLSAVDLSRNLIQQFVHVVHLGSHHYPDSNVVQENHFKDMENISAQEADLRSVEDPGARQEPSEKSDAKLLDPSGHKNLKEKSTSVVAVITFGYQILRYPHFAELCWTTSKLNEGPSADIRGPWKGWPFNSCIIRPCQLTQKDAVSCNSNNINGRDKFTLVRGLIAVGLSAYRGEYKSSREVCLEVRKVLKLLVEQINARIQAGKDRYQYVRLLSQVAYLEDMVNNWSHTLRSFEPEDQTEVTICNVSSAPLPKDHQAPTVEPMGVEHKPNAECGGLQEVQLETGGLPGLAAEGSLNGPVVTIQGEDFQKADLVEGGFQRSLAESSQPADFTTEPIANRTDFAITDEMSPGRAVDVNVDIAISDDMSLEKPIDFEITDNPRKSCEHVTKLEVLCSYSSCSGCTITLQELVKKIIIQEKELSRTCSTVEDIYDLVSSLSTNLCSGIRNLSITPKLGCETFQNFESRESNACQCPSSESRLSKFMDCVCHAGKDIISEELKSSSFYDQPGLPSKYIFRDGVLVSVEPDKEFSFHCKYDTLCLCSLVKLIIRTKHLNSL